MPHLGSGGRAISSHPRDPDNEVVLERLAYAAADWDSIVARYSDAEVYQTAAWLEFLRRTQRAEPVVAVVRVSGRPVGHFVGAIVRRSGVRILGSPLRGWTTQCMGFLLEPGVDRRAAAMALLRFAFRDLRCLHVELADRNLTAETMRGSGYHIEVGSTFVIDLSLSEPEILARMSRTTRKEIRRAIRQGLRVEKASDERFAMEFYTYLLATFSRQGLAPTYDLRRVCALIDALEPSGRVHLLRVRTPDGRSIATSLSVGSGRIAIGWGMGFDRSMDHYHPNELLWWEMIRSWKTCGAGVFDCAGAGAYKEKFGGRQTSTAHFYKSRWPILGWGREAVRHLARARQRLAGGSLGRAERPVLGGRPAAPGVDT